jgi:hypothetical protein
MQEEHCTHRRCGWAMPLPLFTLTRDWRSTDWRGLCWALGAHIRDLVGYAVAIDDDHGDSVHRWTQSGSEIWIVWMGTPSSSDH